MGKHTALRLSSFGFVAFFLSLFIVAAPVTAQSDQFIQITNTAVRACSSTAYIVGMTIAWERPEGTFIWYGTTEPDGSRSDSLSSLNNRTSPLNDWTIGYNFAAQTFPYTTSFYYELRRDEEALSRVTVMVTCTGPSQGFTRVLGPDRSAPDSRDNFGFGDFEAVIFNDVDAEGNLAVNLYCYDPATDTSSLGFVVTQADVDAIGTPSENTLVASAACNAAFYVLTTGEYQINIVYDGKTYVLIDTDLDFINSQRRVE